MVNRYGILDEKDLIEIIEELHAQISYHPVLEIFQCILMRRLETHRIVLKLLCKPMI